MGWHLDSKLKKNYYNLNNTFEYNFVKALSLVFLIQYLNCTKRLIPEHIIPELY